MYGRVSGSGFHGLTLQSEVTISLSTGKCSQHTKILAQSLGGASVGGNEGGKVLMCHTCSFLGVNVPLRLALGHQRDVTEHRMGKKHGESTINIDTTQRKSTSIKKIEHQSGIWCIHSLGFDMVYFVVSLYKLFLMVIFNHWFQRS